jgi:hypothetical protein
MKLWRSICRLNHYLLQIFRFHKRNQQPSESITDYCVAIQRLSEFCEFGNTLNHALRDRRVCGLANEITQRRLLAEADLTYDKAKAIALAAEAATKDTEELRKLPNANLNKLQGKQCNNAYMRRLPVNRISSRHPQHSVVGAVRATILKLIVIFATKFVTNVR